MSAEEFLNSDVKKLGKSLLWEFFDLASNTENVISLSVGEPDFKTPWHISEEGIYAIEKRFFAKPRYKTSISKTLCKSPGNKSSEDFVQSFFCSY